jgi:hypothetical protein
LPLIAKQYQNAGMSDRLNSLTELEQTPRRLAAWQRIAFVGIRLGSLVVGLLGVAFSLAAIIAAWAMVIGPDRVWGATVTKYYGYPAVVALVLTAILRGFLWLGARLNPMVLAPQRRRFRFSLRTLFVGVTTAACLTAWAVSENRWARQRREFLAASGKVHIQAYQCEMRRPYIKWLLFGKDDVTFINLFPGTYDSAYLKQARDLFPEAEIISSSDPNAEPSGISR